ncbi:Fpg/Nei family DNA glycosylase [Rarobacter faecitabidus]|uniref:DNA-(apurinic or apyrimidinic site) lyase n=1 Tax=Rarobacter faecitabidus TaxID=13243 RepID=A0A542ZA56_RARFA|nr:DNA-formamidopyrimidine glycosylase family protein [Rarobacter faecitabidus]TQL57228.1 endonuclease-8 [Rarobacter faecitabidus]
MPEGDVLARVADRLGRALTGRALTLAELRWPGVEPAMLRGSTVAEVASYGKHLLHRTDEGGTLHTHLRMDGSWRIERSGTRQAENLARRPATRAILGNEQWTTAGLDLGMLDIIRTRDERLILARLGPDLLAADFADIGLTQVLQRATERSSSPICEVLLDQRVAAGIGTIYAAESLFERRMWPWTATGELASGELAAIYLTARKLMQRVVTGGFNARVNHVHARKGLPCHRCGTPIARGTANPAPYERPIFYCPRCQSARPIE